MALPSRLSTPMISDASLKALAGLAPFVAGDLIYATGADTLVKLPKGTAGQALKMNAGATAPEWQTFAGASAWTDLGTIDGTGLSSVSLANLSAYRRLRCSGWLKPTDDAVGLILRTSTDNGSNFDAGASDYGWGRMRVTGATVDAAADADDASFPISWLTVGNAGQEAIRFEILIDQFNQATHCWIHSNADLLSPSTVLNSVRSYGRRLSTTARNAAQLRFSSGTIAGGKVTFEVMA